MCCLGTVCRQEGDYAAATALFQEALDVGKALQQKEAVAATQFYLGTVALAQDELAEADDLLHQSLKLMQEIEHNPIYSDMLNTFADLALAQKQPARALRLAGATSAFRAAMKWKLPPVYHAKFDQTLMSARQLLPKDIAASAWAEGEAMTPDAAMAYIVER